jgi:hypothetical protein
LYAPPPFSLLPLTSYSPVISFGADVAGAFEALGLALPPGLGLGLELEVEFDEPPLPQATPKMTSADKAKIKEIMDLYVFTKFLRGTEFGKAYFRIIENFKT